MLEYKPYFYYAKNDINREAIDKVLTFDFENALEHFSNRKQLKKDEFLNLYEIVNQHEIESK
jgi:predicted transcriptional regulator